MLRRYARWLHTGWPAGTVETLPEVREDGTTNVPGLLVVGDLSGVPLLKLALDAGARAVERIAGELGAPSKDEAVVDVAIVGAGVAGVAAAVEAKRRGLSFRLFEAAQPFSTIVNFPKGKPIFTYPTELRPAGALQVTADVKEALVEELEAQRKAAGIEPVALRIDRIERAGGELVVHPAGADGADPAPTRARRVIVAIGRSGNFRRLGVPGEALDKVTNRLHDPKVYAGQRALVVGGGDSALEAAIALCLAGAHVTLSYRKAELARPKPENVEKLEALVRDPMAEVAVERPSSERRTTAFSRRMLESATADATAAGSLTLRLGTEVTGITPDAVTLKGAQGAETLANDVVFSMIGREAPLDFFRRSGVSIRGEWTWGRIAGFALFVLFCCAVYWWKNEGADLDAPRVLASLGDVKDRTTLLGVLAVSAKKPSFYYTLAYSLLVTVFGVRRIRRRRTPYVTAQTLTLMAVQVLPLFLLPEVLLPLMGYRGWFASGVGKSVADALFPLYAASDTVWPAWGHPRAYWQAYGLVLAFPLDVYNVLSPRPDGSVPWAWLGIGAVQTFVLIPLLVWRWGKGAYCGWICSCGALAETLGDQQRTKMPHGPGWNRLNLLGQVVLLSAFALLGLRLLAWAAPGSAPGAWVNSHFKALLDGGPLSYKWIVDVLLGGVIGIGCYFWLSGRVWCRFACPLAALMHVYARVSRFRIFAEKKKCISCNVCTSVCHQGIDVMAFANKGLPMQDPECVRCSACVQSCPTGTLTFGRLDGAGQPVLDRLAASPVQLRERTGRPLPVARG
jgi:thioredoxin reductase/ferredoxin